MGFGIHKFCTCKKAKLVRQVRGGSLIVRCELCGEEAATTYYPPEWQDKTTYTIQVHSRDNEVLPLIKFLKASAAVSTAEGRELVEHEELVFNRSGSSAEILELAKSLADQRIGYRCDPPYPHFVDYQIFVRPTKLLARTKI